MVFLSPLNNGAEFYPETHFFCNSEKKCLQSAAMAYIILPSAGHGAVAQFG